MKQKVQTGYIIHNNVTDEVLSNYSILPKDWSWCYSDAVDLSTSYNPYIFSTKKEVEKALKHLSEVFSQNGDKVDFTIYKTTKYKVEVFTTSEWVKVK